MTGVDCGTFEGYNDINNKSSSDYLIFLSYIDARRSYSKKV